MSTCLIWVYEDAHHLSLSVSLWISQFPYIPSCVFNTYAWSIFALLSRKHYAQEIWVAFVGKQSQSPSGSTSGLYAWEAHAFVLDKRLPYLVFVQPAHLYKTAQQPHLYSATHSFVKGTAWEPIKNTLLLWVFCSSLVYNKLKTTVGEHSTGKTAVPFIDFIATHTNRKCILYQTGELGHTELNRMESFPCV